MQHMQSRPQCNAGDGVHQPFEPELDWNDFGVRVPEERIPVLHEILAAIDDDTYRRKMVSRGLFQQEADPHAGCGRTT